MSQSDRRPFIAISVALAGSLYRACPHSLLGTSALEPALYVGNDPNFQKYMERQRNLYLQQQRGLPPSYDAALTEDLTTTSSVSPSSLSHSTPTVSSGDHCTCHNCIAIRQIRSPVSATWTCTGIRQELPAPTIVPAELDVPQIRINNDGHILNNSSSRNDKDDLILCEMPGDLPAILPDIKPRSPSELSAVPV